MKAEIRIGPISRKPIAHKCTALWRPVYQALIDMKPDEYREMASTQKWFQKEILRIAKELGMAITTRKLNNGSLGVWRLR